MAARRLSWVSRRDVVAVDQDAALLHVVETLQQREHGRLAAAGLADQADALAGPDAQVEIARTPVGRRDRRNRHGRNATAPRAAASGAALGLVLNLMRRQRASRAPRRAAPYAGSYRPARPRDRGSHAECRSPSVLTSTTSPVVAPPRCHSSIAQASSTPCSNHRDERMQQPQLFEIDAGCAAAPCISRPTRSSKRRARGRCRRRRAPAAYWR